MQKQILTFEELLMHGKRQLVESDSPGDTGIEDGTRTSPLFQQIVDINSYMFTTFSTNKGGHNLSIEGVIPLSVFQKIQLFLSLGCYIYMANNPLTKEIVGYSLIDPEDYDVEMSKIPKQMFVDKKQEKDYGLKRLGWVQITDWKKGKALFETGRPPYVTIPTNPIEEGFPSDEVVEIVNNDLLFKGEDPLISIFIEDPIFGRISLYKNLLKYLKSATIK